MASKASNDEGSGSLSSPDEEKKNQPLPPLSKLLRLARPEWPVLSIAFALMILAEATNLYTPILLASAYDRLVEPDDENNEEDNRMKDISRTMTIVLIVHAAGVAMGFVRVSLMGAAGERVVARLRCQLYGHLLHQEMAFFDEHKTGELVSRLTSDTTLLQAGTTQALPEVVLGMVKLMVSVSLMFWISPRLASVTLGCVVVIFVVCIPIGRWIGALSKSYQDVLSSGTTRATEALGAMRTVQSFAAEHREDTRYQQVIGQPDDYPYWWPTAATKDGSKTTYSVGFFKALVGSSFFTLVFGVGFATMYISLWYGFQLVSNGTISLGDLTAFQSYIFQIGAGLGQTSRFITQLMEAQGASGRIFFLLERVPQIPTPVSEAETRESKNSDEDEESSPKTSIYVPPHPLLKPGYMEGAIEFENVSFAYPSRPTAPVLRNFSLSIPTNTTTALVGASGAGKSTVVALLQRFYDVTGGSICIDGRDIRSLDVQWLRSHIGYVQQEPQLFGLSVRENIAYGVNRAVSQQEIEDVARQANAHEFITQWPSGYDTMLGERGIKCSGGQKQVSREIIL